MMSKNPLPEFYYNLIETIILVSNQRHLYSRTGNLQVQQTLAKADFLGFLVQIKTVTQ